MFICWHRSKNVVVDIVHCVKLCNVNKLCVFCGKNISKKEVKNSVEKKPAKKLIIIVTKKKKNDATSTATYLRC